MDRTQRPTGIIEPTPEARPLTPPTMQQHFADPIQFPGSAGQAASKPTGQQTEQTVGQAGSQGAGGRLGHKPSAEEVGREVADKLKPVAVAAEEVTARVLDLTAKGLTKLAGMLEERRHQRTGGDRD